MVAYTIHIWCLMCISYRVSHFCLRLAQWLSMLVEYFWWRFENSKPGSVLRWDISPIKIQLCKSREQCVCNKSFCNTPLEPNGRQPVRRVNRTNLVIVFVPAVGVAEFVEWTSASLGTDRDSSDEWGVCPAVNTYSWRELSRRHFHDKYKFCSSELKLVVRWWPILCDDRRRRPRRSVF